VVTVSHESTTRKRAEAARQRAEAELENLRRMEVLGLLAASVAHDFRNILGIIQNNVTLAGMDLPEDHPSRAPLADVGRAVERARGLCSQLGALARRSEGAQQQVDLNAVVRDVIALLTPPARPSAGASLALAQDLHPVRGDPDELGQVVLNLATNGLDAMAGRGRLSLTTRNVLRPREGAASAAWACLSVTDTGPGIDPTVLPRVFEPYFSTKRDRGMGLGLAIVQRVVSDHGGFVEVESIPGRGSEFRVYLPAAPARASEC
jgi:signal transduction histidine kinase